MAAVTPAVRSHLWRLVRYPAFVSLAAALVVPLVKAAVVRWPAIGAVVALLEIILRTAVPTVPASPPVAGPPPTTPPAA